MAHWLIKSEPRTFSWDQLARDRRTAWDGVRNHEARNNLQAMHKGDRCLFYHSGAGAAVVGVAEVEREAYPDPTADDPRWVAVDVLPRCRLAQAVPLKTLRADPRTRGMVLIRQGRLSVSPVTPAEFSAILELGGSGAREPGGSGARELGKSSGQELTRASGRKLEKSSGPEMKKPSGPETRRRAR